MAVRRLAEEQPESFSFTPENLEWAKKTIAKYPEGRQASAVVPLLWRAQEQHGWLPEPAIRLVADMLEMPYIRVLENATFYTMFQLKPVGTTAHIQVCGTTPCQLRGAEDMIAICKRRINAHAFELSEDGRFSWEEVECLGACVNAPMVQVGADTYEDLTPESFEALIDGFSAGTPPEPGPQSGRKSSEPITGATTLTDPSLYDGSRYRDDAPAPGDAGEPAATADAPAEAGAATTSDEPAAGASVDPATPAAADQKAAKPDPSDRPEEAAARGSATATAADKDIPADGQAGASTASETGADATDGTKASGDAATATPDETAQAAVEAERERKLAALPANATPEERADAVGLRPAGHAAGEGHKDDLQMISGIGPKIEGILNELGIFEFEQIAAWTPENVAWVDTYLKFKGRVERENWIEQAKTLAAGGHTDFSKRGGTRGIAAAKNDEES